MFFVDITDLELRQKISQYVKNSITLSIKHHTYDLRYRMSSNRAHHFTVSLHSYPWKFVEDN